MKVFVTGVGGQLGHDVMNELHKRGYEGVGSDIAPQYSGAEDGSAVTAQKAQLVLLHNGEEVSRQDLTLTAGEADGTFEAPISAVTFTTPALEDDHQLDLVLEISLSAGDPLTNNSCSWYYIDGGLTMVVG